MQHSKVVKSTEGGVGAGDLEFVSAPPHSLLKQEDKLQGM